MRCRHDFCPRILTHGWHRLEVRVDGCAYQSNSLGLRVILSADKELDGKEWIHLSVSRKSRIPSWDDLVFVRDVFIGRNKKCVQIIPDEASYVNDCVYCLHIWHCIDGDGLPDFTKGSGKL
jgi:hypothetical protein